VTPRIGDDDGYSNGSLVLENVVFENVGIPIQKPDKGAALPSMSDDFVVHAWGQGHEYTPNSSPSNFLGTLTPVPRPGSLLNGTKYYERSKPNYNDVPASGLYSVRDGGAKGDGVTDDTTALESTLDSASSNGKIVFFDYGIYKVTKTLSVRCTQG